MVWAFSSMDDDDGLMASAAKPACSGSLLWRGSNGILVLHLTSCSQSTSTSLIDLIEDTFALTANSGLLSGACGRQTSSSLVRRGEQIEEDGIGGAEQ